MYLRLRNVDFGRRVNFVHPGLPTGNPLVTTVYTVRLIMLSVKGIFKCIVCFIAFQWGVAIQKTEYSDTKNGQISC